MEYRWSGLIVSVLAFHREGSDTFQRIFHRTGKASVANQKTYKIARPLKHSVLYDIRELLEVRAVKYRTNNPLI